MPYSRREFLRSGGAIAGTVAAASVSGCLGYAWKFRGATTKPGNAIEFTTRRKRIKKQQATHIVRTKAQFISALTQPNAIIWIPGGVTITINDRSNIPVAPGVTIASNRNLKTKQGKRGKGALIQTDKFNSMLFVVPEGDCRLTGVRLKGPMTQYFDPPKDQIYDYAAGGIHFQGKAAIVDNCEVYGWTSEGLGIGTRGTPTQGWIHHNKMHHNQMNHLGYPMELFNGISLIEWNYFAYYRHAITGYGYRSNGYEARFNVIGPPGGSEYSFAFDMHSLGEQPNFPESRKLAGKYVNVHHNVFELTSDNALSISGIPAKYARFCNNWTAHSKDGDIPAVHAPDAATVKIKSNVYGSKTIKEGRQWLKNIAAKLPLSNGVPSIGKWTRPPGNERLNSRRNDEHGSDGGRMGRPRNERRDTQQNGNTTTTAATPDPRGRH